MRRRGLWLTLLLIVVSITIFIKTYFSFESNIRVIVVNESGKIVENASIDYFDKSIVIPRLESNQHYERTIDISNERGEGSMTFHYPMINKPNIILSGYMEGGATELYRGKITITILENEEVKVTVKRNFISIL